MKVPICILLLCYIGTLSLCAISKKSYSQSFGAFLSSSSVNDEEPTSETLYVDNNFNTDDTTDGDNTDVDGNYVPIMALAYNGYWNSSSANTSQTIDFFIQSSGIAEFTTAKDYYLDIDDFLIFTLYDGDYTDQKYAVINLNYDNETDFYPSNSTFQNDNVTFFVYLFDQYSQLGQRMCAGSYQLNFMDSSTGGPYQKASNDYQNVYAQFQLNSPECSIALTSIVSLKNEIKTSELLAYTIGSFLICALQLWTCVKLSYDILQSEAEGVRISLLSLGFFIGWDVFLCLFYLYNALTVSEYFHYFLVPAFTYFVLVSIFETRLILLVWKSKYYNHYLNLNQVRRGVVTFYIMFYGFLTVFLLLCYFFLPATWLFYALSAFFLPQIIHNAMRGQRYKFNTSFILIIGALRIAIPLYARGYAENIFRLTPDIDFVFIYSGAIIAQLLVLFLQSKLGSRFFIPACFLPPKYNYFKKINSELTTDEEKADSCPICMDNLNEVPTDVKTPLINIKRSKKVRLMQTPCNHQFHEQCLRGWMDLKLECPSCRAKLPSID